MLRLQLRNEGAPNVGAFIPTEAPLRIGAFITPGALLCFGVLAFEVTARGFGVEGEGERL
jgi:hypothetical protein